VVSSLYFFTFNLCHYNLAVLAGVEGGDLSDEYVMEQLIRSDTAKIFNIPISAVSVYNIVRRETVVGAVQVLNPVDP
jgi:hypothetical protein